MTRYPGTTWDPVSGKGGLTFARMVAPKIVLHTTEGGHWPDYPYPPHLTVDYRDGARSRRQHVDLDLGAYSMKSGSSCGSANYQLGPAYQIEHIGYAADVHDYPDDWYEGLVDTLEWFKAEMGVPYVFPDDWRRGDGYGPDAPQRLSCADFRDFTGILAHQHAPSPNDHWDAPFDVARIQEILTRRNGMTWKSKDGYTYTDTDEWAPHDNGIKWAIDSGVMVGDRSRGKGDARFNAPDPLSRGEAATTLKRFADDAGISDEIAQ